MAKRPQKLIIRTEDGVAHECVVHPGVPFIIGRGKDANLRLDFKSVSRQHCRLEIGADGSIEIVDLGSQNGSRLNGRRIDRASLKTGDDLLVATVPLKIEIPKPPQPGVPSGMRLSPEEQQLLDQLEQMGLQVRERVDLGSPIPVYKAHRTDLDQDVLVKAVRVGEGADAQEKAGRLLREAKLAAKMRHRNIVQLYDVRQLPGVIAIIFEWVDGRTLQQEISRKGPLTATRALEIGIELCKALEHAHSLGVVHRNLTPATVMVSDDGEVKLVDFGLAKSIIPIGAKGTGHVTRQGQAIGAVEYAPPEQARDASAVDHRADVYAVGSTLYHALAGEPPLIQVDPLHLDDPIGEVPATITEVAPHVPEAARAVIERAMQADPADRYQSAEQLRHALEGAIALLEGASAAMRRSKTVELDVARIAASASSGTGTGFQGRIQTDEFVELLQMVEHNRKSGTLEIYGNPTDTGRRVSGSIFFRGGSIVEARAGDHRGAEALFELLMLPSGNFRVVFGEPGFGMGDETPAPPLAISVALMEVMRRKDEAKSGHA